MRVPHHLKETIAELTAELRNTPQVNQRSGVSVRFSIGALESLAASALRRAVMNREDEAVPRPADLYTIMPSVIGRLEFDTFDEGREPEILEHALKLALLEVWDRHLRGEDFSALIEAFDAGLEAETSDAMGSEAFIRQFPMNDKRMTTILERSAARLGVDEATPAARAGALEFCLEGLHLNKRISKSGGGRPGGATYSGAR